MDDVNSPDGLDDIDSLVCLDDVDSQDCSDVVDSLNISYFIGLISLSLETGRVDFGGVTLETGLFSVSVKPFSGDPVELADRTRFAALS